MGGSGRTLKSGHQMVCSLNWFYPHFLKRHHCLFFVLLVEVKDRGEPAVDYCAVNTFGPPQEAALSSTVVTSSKVGYVMQTPCLLFKFLMSVQRSQTVNHLVQFP